jgi:Ca2+-binding RTX toxin-like protein
VTASAGGGTVSVPSYGGNSFLVILANSGDNVTIGSPTRGLADISADVRVQAFLGQTPHVILDDQADTNSHTVDLGSDSAFGYPAGTFGYVVAGLADSSLGRGYIGLELDPVAQVSILGGAADDVFRIKNFIGAPAISIVAEPATSTRTNQHNKLDYSAYTGDISVDFPLGKATGFASIGRIQDVTGSIGNDILVGDANPNVLKGVTGRTLIIGGGGGDTITGGNGENILIGGTTLWDTNPAALQAILHEFLQTYDTADPVNDFNIRINNIRMGKGTLTNSGYHLQGSKGKLSQTVFDDGVKNTVSDGGSLTWFWLDALDVYTSTNPNNRKDNV